MTAAVGAYLCAACTPPKRCAQCDGPIVGRRHNASYCQACAEQRQRDHSARPTTCHGCGIPLGPRATRTLYCRPCATEHERQLRLERDRARRAQLQGRAGDDEDRRDPALERCIDQHLAEIRASRRYRLTPEAAVAQRGDWGAYCNARTPDTAGLSLPELRPRPSRAKGGRA